jgi:hypothetical protein
MRAALQKAQEREESGRGSVLERELSEIPLDHMFAPFNI